MRPVRITYDPDGDILYITFGQPVASTGYQLSDQILLRVDSQTQKATGLTISIILITCLCRARFLYRA